MKTKCVANLIPIVMDNCGDVIRMYAKYGPVIF